MAVFHIDLYSAMMRKNVPISAVLPIERPDMRYDDKPFKTLYLLHGYTGANNDWLYGSRIQELAMVYNVAVIMPSCTNSFYLDDEILGEYSERYVTEELVRFTRRAFPLSAERDDTAIGGLSMGGYGALRNGLKHHDVFGAVIALSSALIVDQIAKLKEGEDTATAPYSYYRHVFGDLSKVIGSDNDPKALADRIVNQKLSAPKIFMACGTEDFLLEANRDMDRHLAKIGLAHEYRESKGVHNMAFWDEYIEKAMAWLYGQPGGNQ